MTRELRTRCPYCFIWHELVSEAMSDEDVAPVDGDMTLCFKCGQVCIYSSAHTTGLRKPSKKERAELEQDPRVIMMLEGWHRFKPLRH